MQIDISKIIQLSHKERWQKFCEILNERGIPPEDCPPDYPDDVWQLYKAINDQDYRDANNGESPKKIDFKDTDLYKMVFSK